MTGLRRARLIASVLMPFLGACQASPAMELPVIECVGRMELRLPGAAEVAIQEAQPQAGAVFFPSHFVGGYEFQDKTKVSHSAMSYSGDLTVFHIADEDVWRRIVVTAKGIERGRIKSHIENHKQKKTTSVEFNPTSRILKNSQGISFGSLGRDVIIRRQSIALGWRGDDDKIFTALDQDLMDRPNGQSPQRQGVCVPHFFIPDNGRVPRNISVTYRLLNQPDVLINLKDASAVRKESGHLTRNAKADLATVSFWEQFLVGTKLEKLGIPWRRQVDMAGLDGVSSKVRLNILRDVDESKAGDVNAGYLTLVRGDPDAEEDMPDLQLFIVQNVDYAKRKNIKPLTEEQFFAMAEAIRESVRRRPVQ